MEKAEALSHQHDT